MEQDRVKGEVADTADLRAPSGSAVSLPTGSPTAIAMLALQRSAGNKAAARVAHEPALLQRLASGRPGGGGWELSRAAGRATSVSVARDVATATAPSPQTDDEAIAKLSDDVFGEGTFTHAPLVEIEKETPEFRAARQAFADSFDAMNKQPAPALSDAQRAALPQAAKKPEVINARNNVTQAFNSLSQARAQMDLANTLKTMIDSTVPTIKNQIDVITTQKKLAEAQDKLDKIKFWCDLIGTAAGPLMGEWWALGQATSLETSSAFKNKQKEDWLNVSGQLLPQLALKIVVQFNGLADEINALQDQLKKSNDSLFSSLNAQLDTLKRLANQLSDALKNGATNVANAQKQFETTMVDLDGIIRSTGTPGLESYSLHSDILRVIGLIARFDTAAATLSMAGNKLFKIVMSTYGTFRAAGVTGFDTDPDYTRPELHSGARALNNRAVEVYRALQLLPPARAKKAELLVAAQASYNEAMTLLGAPFTVTATAN